MESTHSRVAYPLLYMYTCMCTYARVCVIIHVGNQFDTNRLLTAVADRPQGLNEGS